MNIVKFIQLFLAAIGCVVLFAVLAGSVIFTVFALLARKCERDEARAWRQEQKLRAQAASEVDYERKWGELIEVTAARTDQAAGEKGIGNDHAE